MLVFKSRRRVSPALRAENTPSEKRVVQNLVQARREVESWIEANLTTLMDAIAHRPWTTVADIIPDEPWYEFQEYLQGELLAETVDAGFRATDGPVGKAVTPILGYRFDATRPEASSWAAREAGGMVSEITRGQRNLIRDLISRGQMEGITVDQTARTIRQSVGLTTEQAGWVDNFYERNVAQGIGAGMSSSQAAARASTATSRYHDRIHRYRAETIARTEIARAASEGRQLAWNQGIEQGFISGSAEKEWIAEADACEICSPRNGTRHPVGKPWPNGEPPAHPNCRCDMLLIPDGKATPEPKLTFLDSIGSFFPTQWATSVGIDLVGDVTLRTMWRIIEENLNDQAKLTERRDFFAGQGRPERAAIYDARSYQERTGLRSFTRTKRDSFSVSVGDDEVKAKSVARYRGTDDIRDIFDAAGISTPDIYELDPSEAKLFHKLIIDAKNSNKYGASVQDYSVEEYATMRLFITDKGGAGFAIKDGDELVSVFRGDTSMKGVADWMVHLGIEQGARRADAFDTVLPFIYGDHGMVVVARTSWNDAFSPPGWNKRTFAAFNNGEPDVVFMVYNPRDYFGYFPRTGMKFGKDDYDVAYAYAKTVLGWLQRSMGDPPTRPLLRPQDLPRWTGTLEPPGGFLSFDDIIGQAGRLLADAGDNWRDLSKGDALLSQLYKVRGFDFLPTVVDGVDFDALLNSGAVALYRGFGNTADTQAHMNSFRFGDYFPGRGIHGNGTYSADWLAAASAYAEGDMNNLLRMTLSPNARIITDAELKKEWIAFTRSSAYDALSPAAQDLIDDMGRFAVAMGYDAIQVVASGQGGRPRSSTIRDYVVILNRGMLTVDRLNGLGPGAIWAADVNVIAGFNLGTSYLPRNELLDYARQLGYKVVVFDSGERILL